MYCPNEPFESFNKPLYVKAGATPKSNTDGHPGDAQSSFARRVRKIVRTGRPDQLDGNLDKALLLPFRSDPDV